MQRVPIWLLLTCFLALPGVAGTQPPRPDDLSGEDRFVPFYEWWLDERPHEALVMLEAYRASLRQLVEKPPAEAAEALRDLEKRLEQGFVCLDAVQKELVRRLAERDAEALVPLIALHESSYALHISHGDHWLADNTQAKIEQWTALYAEHAETPTARARAARLFFAFAQLMRRLSVEGLLFRSVSMLEQGLGRDEALDPLLLHALAIRQERLNDARRALQALERLRALEPEDPEILLRQARNQGSLGQTDAALATLETLEDPSVPDWIRRLAVQERVRLLDRQGRDREALATLRRGVSRFPHDARLGLALAARERLVEDAPPGAAAHLLDAHDHDPGLSPRARYELGPQERFQALLDRFGADVWETLPHLEAVLEWDFRNVWGLERSRSLVRQVRRPECRRESNPQYPELLR